MAHRLLRLSGEEGLRELAAGVVAACAAVDLVGLRRLPDARERARDRRLVRLVVNDSRRGICGRPAVREASRGGGAYRRRRVGCEESRETRGAARHGRAVDASSRTRQHLDEQLALEILGMQLELSWVEVLEHPAEVLKPRYGNVSYIGLAVAQRVVHSAFDGVEASFLGRTKRELGLFAERDAALREELLERREDDGEGKLVGMCVRLVLLRGAGPEEHDLRAVAVLLLDETAVCAHRRGKG